MDDASMYIDTSVIQQEIEDTSERKKLGVIPIFYMRTVEDVEKSSKTGRRIFKEVPYLKIIIPGSRDVVDRRALRADQEKYPRHWAAFLAKRDMPKPEGFPIDQWAGCTRAEAETLSASNVFTIEQLSSCSDDDLRTIGRGFMSLKYKAQKFLESQTDMEALNKAVAEKEDYREKYEALLQTHQELKDICDQLEAEIERLKKPKRKSGVRKNVKES